MRRGALAALLVVVLGGFAMIAVAAARSKRLDQFGLGVLPGQVVAQIGPRDRLCQTPVSVPETFAGVAVVLDPPEPRGPIRVTVRRPGVGLWTGTGNVLASGTIRRQTLTGQEITAPLDRAVQPGQFVAVCLEPQAGEPVRVWGDFGPQRTPVTSSAWLNGADTGGDVFVRFPRRDPNSVLARIPAAFRHATPFKLGGLGAWVFWLLAAGVLIGAPVLLARALGAAAALEGDGRGR